MKGLKYLTKIRKEFPNLHWDSYKLITTGWDHVVIILDEDFVFRFPNYDGGEEKLRDEIALLDFLQDKIDAAGIPKYSHVPVDSTFAGHRLLPGMELTKDVFDNLTAEKRMVIVDQLAGFLTQLHSIDVSGVKDFNVSKQDQVKFYDDLQKNIGRVIKRLSEKEAKLLKKYLDDFETMLRGDLPQALIHKDLTKEHILWDDNSQRVNIIDFSDRAIFDPAMDFAGLFIYGEDFVGSVYNKYAAQKDEGFLQRASMYFKRMPILMMKVSFTTDNCTFKDGHEKFKKRFS